MIVMVRILVTLLLICAGYCRVANAAEVRSQLRTIEDWRPFAGRVVSRSVATISAPIAGSNVIVAVAEEGTRVKAGDVLARFATDALIERKSRIESDLATARAVLVETQEGRHPLAISEFDRDIGELQSEIAQYAGELNELERLVDEGLVASQELGRIQRLHASKSRQLTAKQKQRALTTQTLHPNELKRLQTTLERHQREYDALNEQIGNAEVRAAQDGVVVLIPVFIGGSHRVVRQGDEVNQGRVFMQIVDTSDVRVELEVAESRSAGLAQDQVAVIHPLSNPSLEIPAKISRIGRVAKTRASANSGNGNRFIDVIVDPNTAEYDGVLVPGASVEARVLIRRAKNVIAVPRDAIRWHEDRAHVVVSGTLRRVELGLTDALWVEVNDGLSEGEIIELP